MKRGFALVEKVQCCVSKFRIEIKVPQQDDDDDDDDDE
jgi:hypothetical protein